MRITIKEIARLANVSKSTVSRVINESKDVSENTRKEVLNAIEMLNYSPNEIARSLAMNRTRIFSLIVQDIRNPYHALACWIAERVFRRHGYKTIICNADNNPDLEASFLMEMKYRNVDGILCFGGEENAFDIIDFKKKEELPIVIVDREIKGVDLASVVLDNVYGAELAVNYLFELGHANIAFVTSDYTEAERRRREGYHAAFKKIGINADDEHTS